MASTQTECKRCGQCCNHGGPALHGPDLELVRSGAIPLSALITLRKGEMAQNPVAGGLKPLSVELIKLKGTGREWNCCYFDKTANSCTIYDRRPLACRVLKCWEPDEILGMVEKDTLSRLDILGDDDPLVNLIREHERLYPCPDLQKLADALPDVPESMRRDLQKLVNGDLRFRDRVVKEFSLKLSDELFYFGRPVFQLLQPFGIRVVESGFGLELVWK